MLKGVCLRLKQEAFLLSPASGLFWPCFAAIHNGGVGILAAQKLQKDKAPPNLLRTRNCRQKEAGEAGPIGN